MKQKILIHARLSSPGHRKVIIEDASSHGFETSVPHGDSNPFSVQVSGEEADLYVWAGTLDSAKALVMYHDPKHPSNLTLKKKCHVKGVKNVSNTTSKAVQGSPSVSYISDGLYTSAAASLIYRFPQQSSTSRVPIAYVSFGGGVYLVTPNDPQVNWNILGLVAPNIPTFTITTIDGATNSPGVNPDEDLENILDLTVISGNCPFSAITMYLGTGSTYADVYNVFSAAITSANGYKAISSSWSFAGVLADFTAADELLTYAASRGLNITCATGDTGSPELATYFWPTSSPNLISVGGTTLTYPVLNYYTPLMNEVGWDNGSGDYSTGGVTIYPMPQYQKGVISSANGVLSSKYRCVPDVSSHANGYTLAYDGSIYSGGGTSAAAPAIAALVALLNVNTFLPPILYANLGSSLGWYHSVTQNNNIGYVCSPGYNLMTGIGSLDGILLQQLLHSLGYV